MVGKKEDVVEEEEVENEKDEVVEGDDEEVERGVK